MDIPVKVEAFEGPMDLLLQLIEKNKINIYDIPIAEITDQYLTVINSMKIPDLDSESAFLVMASILVNIKSRMLLPKEKDESGEEVDPRNELVERLLEYKFFRYSAEILREREKDASREIYREPDLPSEVSDYCEEPDIEAMTADLTLAKLHAIYDFVIKKQNDKIDPVRSRFGKIRREPVSLLQCLSGLTEYAKKNVHFNFINYLSEQPDKVHVIVNFLALLELMKIGALKAMQSDICGDIAVSFEENPEFSEEELAAIGEL